MRSPGPSTKPLVIAEGEPDANSRKTVSMSAAPLLEVAGLCKSYSAPVLTDVDFELRAGEVHALLGANGAGKSTLVKIISGLTPANSGRLAFRGNSYAPQQKADAEQTGIQIVQQELNLIPTLSVAENLFLNRLPRRFGVVDRRTLLAQARAALASVNLQEVEPTTPVDRLGIGQRQLVEIAAALSRPCNVLILDEPTAALTDPQIDRLFAHIRRLKAEGVGIIYISHRMEELRKIADRATILRDGRVVLTAPMEELTSEKIVQSMVGKEVQAEAEHPVRSARRHPVEGGAAFGREDGQRCQLRGACGGNPGNCGPGRVGKNRTAASDLRRGSGGKG